MTMEDWAKRIDIYLAADDLAVLQNRVKHCCYCERSCRD